jgi:hypothetical protein
MDLNTAEERIAAWLEETVELKGKVYRNALPPHEREGFELRLVSGVPSGLNRVNEFTLELKGFATDRGSLWENFDRLFAALPLQKYNGFLYVDVKGEVKFSVTEKKGLQVACGTVELAAAFV